MFPWFDSKEEAITMIGEKVNETLLDSKELGRIYYDLQMAEY
jgi:hypothetical protein